MKVSIGDIQSGAAAVQDVAVACLRDLIRIQSPSGGEGKVVRNVAKKMETAGFDEVRTDGFGNVLGRIGSGRKVIAFDAHLDTVGVGDPRAWNVDPFGAEIKDGVMFGRGACDQKGGMAALIAAGTLMKHLEFDEEATVWIVGSVLEEDCDGLCWHYLLSERILEPDLVVLTEPTNLQVYRGHRGRMEIEVTTRGISCHGSAPERGVNAIYKMAPVLTEIERLNDGLPGDPFLGKGSVTVSEIRSTAPSLCAVADSCTIHLDRRLTQGETDVNAIAEIDSIVRGVEIARDTEIAIPIFERPSHTGLVFPMRQYYPAWSLPESDRFVQQALQARELALGEKGTPGKWMFSTNGVGTMGLHGVPTIGFGPGNEIHAHAPTDQCPLDHLQSAVAFYTALAFLFAEGK